MSGLKQLRSRIKSIKTTQKITKAMQVVAATKFTKAKSLIKNSEDYIEEIAPTLIKLISELNKRTDANGMRSFIKRFEAELPKEIANQVPLSKEHINENSSRSNSPTPSATMPKPSGRNL